MLPLLLGVIGREAWAPVAVAVLGHVNKINLLLSPTEIDFLMAEDCQ